MSVKSIMDPRTTVTAESDCISHLYKLMLDAASVETIGQTEFSLDWCRGIQHQISNMVHGLSSKQSIHRDLGGEALEYVPEGYEAMITFLSGLRP